MNILITGASGLIGSGVLMHFVNRGHSLFSLQRSGKTAPIPFWQFDRLSADRRPRSFEAVIHLAGDPIAASRWTARKKSRILESRIRGTRELASYCATLDPLPEIFLAASATGYYGNRGDRVLDENDTAGTQFVSEVCREWERACEPASKAGIRVVNARIGMVLSGHGGSLPIMLPSFRLGLAGIVGTGAQYLSWIDLRDVIGALQFLLEHRSISGPVNLVSPEPVTNRNFTKTLGTLLNRPTVMKMPAFVARLVFGQLGEELVLSSTRVKPRVLQQHSYRFRCPELESSLRYCLETPSIVPEEKRAQDQDHGTGTVSDRQ